LPAVTDPNVLVSSLTQDDAAVYRLSDARALVATVDFFTPIVDDPNTFGAITAANALSDLYAMGATPLFALSLVAWPRTPEVLALVGDAVDGMVDKAREAGVFVVGGHSIEDPEPKLGMVAVGEVNPAAIYTNAGARPGDHLVLTKPIGTGILATALKRSLIGDAEMAPAIESMTALNSGAVRAARAVGGAIHAATDVTGFGLIGHLHAMVTASGVAARVNAAMVPVLDGVADLIAKGAVPGGTTRNVEDAAAYARWDAGLPDATRITLCDAQTSGGLLLAVASEASDRLVAELKQARTPATRVIGEITAGEPGIVEVSR
jgi:selenide,water dikinase